MNNNRKMNAVGSFMNRARFAKDLAKMSLEIGMHGDVNWDNIMIALHMDGMPDEEKVEQAVDIWNNRVMCVSDATMIVINQNNEKKMYGSERTYYRRLQMQKEYWENKLKSHMLRVNHKKYLKMAAEAQLLFANSKYKDEKARWYCINEARKKWVKIKVPREKKIKMPKQVVIEPTFKNVKELQEFYNRKFKETLLHGDKS